MHGLGFLINCEDMLHICFMHGHNPQQISYYFQKRIHLSIDAYNIVFYEDLVIQERKSHTLVDL